MTRPRSVYDNDFTADVSINACRSRLKRAVSMTGTTEDPVENAMIVLATTVADAALLLDNRMARLEKILRADAETPRPEPVRRPRSMTQLSDYLLRKRRR